MKYAYKMVHERAGAKDLSESDETEKQAPPQDTGGTLYVCSPFQGEEALRCLRKECGHGGTHGRQARRAVTPPSARA